MAYPSATWSTQALVLWQTGITVEAVHRESLEEDTEKKVPRTLTVSGAWAGLTFLEQTLLASAAPRKK